MEAISASRRGGAVACEGCKSLNLSGPFGFVGQHHDRARRPMGGAIFTDGPARGQGREALLRTFSGRTADSSDNRTATPRLANVANGGAIFATDDLTISKTLFEDNRVVGNGAGGAISMDVVRRRRGDDEADGLTFEDNTRRRPRRRDQTSRGTAAKLKATRIAVMENEALTLRRRALHPGRRDDQGVGLRRRTLSAAADASSSAQGGGIFANSGNAAGVEDAAACRGRASRTTRSPAATTSRAGASIRPGWTSGSSTRRSARTKRPLAGAIGGGVFVDQNEASRGRRPAARSSSSRPSARTWRGIGTTDGDAIFASLARQRDLDHARRSSTRAPTAAPSTAGTDIQSGGYNVEDIVDPDCGIDAATDSHEQRPPEPRRPENGSPPVGRAGSAASVRRRDRSRSLTRSRTTRARPPTSCRPRSASRRQVAEDGRARRPAAPSATAATPAPSSSRPASRQIVARRRTRTSGGTRPTRSRASSARTTSSSRRAGTTSSRSTRAGLRLRGLGRRHDPAARTAPTTSTATAGTDLVSYNNAIAPADREPGREARPRSHLDRTDFFSIEDLQGSEDDDDIIGSGKDDLLIGGGDPRTRSRAAAAIDTIDAKDGEADVADRLRAGRQLEGEGEDRRGARPGPGELLRRVALIAAAAFWPGGAADARAATYVVNRCGDLGDLSPGRRRLRYGPDPGQSVLAPRGDPGGEHRHDARLHQLQHPRGRASTRSLSRARTCRASRSRSKSTATRSRARRPTPTLFGRPAQHEDHGRALRKRLFFGFGSTDSDVRGLAIGGGSGGVLGALRSPASASRAASSAPTRRGPRRARTASGFFSQEPGSIGGFDPEDRNLVSGNDGTGISMNPSTIAIGNYVGTEADGRSPLPNVGTGFSKRARASSSRTSSRSTAMTGSSLPTTTTTAASSPATSSTGNRGRRSTSGRTTDATERPARCRRSASELSGDQVGGAGEEQDRSSS